MTLVSEIAPTQFPDPEPNAKQYETKRGGYTVLTWGCQMNEDDSQQMAAMLENQGYT